MLLILNRLEMKIGTIIKSSVRLITFFIPQAVLAKLASELAIWAVESLVKNDRTEVKEEGLAIVEKVILEGLKKK